jgi:hypothetical protein
VEPDAGFLSGRLNGSGSTVLTLLRNGNEADTLTVTGDQYIWKGIQPGDYTLIAEREGYVTYSTDLTIVSGENSLDLTLCRPGDVVGIGTLNMGDFAAIYAHVKRTAVLSGYARDCADFDGNGVVNIGDVAGLYAKIRNAV